MTAAVVEAADARHERACLVALASLLGIGPATLRACAASCGAGEAWEALVSGRGRSIPALAAIEERTKNQGAVARLAEEARTLDPGALLERHEAAGQRVVAYGEPGYPLRLLDDHAPPAVLFLRGTDDALALPTVAIVGTRNATRLGRDTAGMLAAELVDRGISVVSGLALGIDGAAHEAVVGRSGGGAPVGVIATGLERAYPGRHRLLHHQVASTGLLVSESPLGSEPTRWRFPARNRIIAALSDVTVVVESRSAGGSMLTAGEAVARDRTVLAVPGHPTSPASAGTLDLIADGAVPVRDVDDVLVALGCGGRKRLVDPPEVVAGKPGEPAGPVASQLLELLEGAPRTLGELLLAGTLGMDQASVALLELERAGLVARSGAWFERTGPVAGPMRTGRR